jgi:hypothetical protein
MSWKALDIILHIGYHKTGTTFLQKSVFPNNSEIFYLGRSWISNKLERYFFDFSFINDSDFDAKIMNDRFSEIVDEIVRLQKIDIAQKKVLLISHESLHSGSDYFGLRIQEQADRLKQVFPNAKIIIGVRNQLKMIESNYTNYIHHGGKLSFNNFFNQSKLYNNGLRLKLRYDHLISLYFNYFKKENVHVMVFEDVFSNNKIKLTELNAFLNIETRVKYNQAGINKKLSKSSINFLRLLNKVLAKDFNAQYTNRLRGHQTFLERLRWYVIKILKNIEDLKIVPFSTKNNVFLNVAQINKAEAYFEESNRILSEQIQIDLKQFGYKY